MREIKFRGKRVDNGEFVYGNLVSSKEVKTLYILNGDYSEFTGEYCWYEVIPETVGQYTGIKDKNGKEIYEGDIVSFIGLSLFTVKFDEGKFYFYGEHDDCDMDELDTRSIEIIGNIHEEEVK